MGPVQMITCRGDARQNSRLHNRICSMVPPVSRTRLPACPPACSSSSSSSAPACIHLVTAPAGARRSTHGAWATLQLRLFSTHTEYRSPRGSQIYLCVKEVRVCIVQRGLHFNPTLHEDEAILRQSNNILLRARRLPA